MLLTSGYTYWLDEQADEKIAAQILQCRLLQGPKLVAAALKVIYGVLNAAAGDAVLAAFEVGAWGRPTRPSCRVGGGPVAW